MSLTFYFGASGAGKSHLLYETIIQRSMEQKEKKFLIIVPDQFTMQTQKDIVSMHPRHGIMNIDVLSFGRLSHRIFDETGCLATPVLDDTGKSLVLRKVIQNLKETLPVIGSNLKKIGYIHEVKSAISEFMQYGISIADMKSLTEAAKERGALYYKLKDLEVLYKGFAEYTREKFVTTEETLEKLAGVLGESVMVKNSVIVFDGFTGFTPIQNRVIQQMLLLAEEVIVTVLMDERQNPYKMGEEQELFYLSKKTVISLEKLAKEGNVSRGKDVWASTRPNYRFRDNPELAHLEQNIFRYPQVSYHQVCEHINIQEASNKREEIRNIATMIRRMVREEGICYRDIAVIAGNLGDYDVYVEEEFTKLSIPFFIDRTRGIILNPFIEYIKSALLVVLKSFSYESVFHFLRCGMAELEPAEVDKLENYVLATGIRGKKAWNSPFTRKSREMSQENQAETLEELNGLRKKVTEQFVLFLQPAETAEGQVKQLYDFLMQRNAQRCLKQYEDYFTEKGDLSSAKEYGQIYRLVMELLDQIVELLGDEKMSRAEFLEILEAGFGEIEVGIIPQNVDRVLVGDMERTRLKQVKTLFMIGINDGNVPKSGSKGGLLSDIDREFLARAEFELAPTPREQMYIQRLYLYMNMTKPSENLMISYVRSGSDGKSRKPSYLIRILTAMYTELKVKAGKKEDAWSIESPQHGLPFLAAYLQEYAKGRLSEEEEQIFYLLYDNYEKQENYSGLTKQLTKNAFYRYQGTSLGKRTAQLLYGQMLVNSVSRLETFAACAYSHFLQYGLSLEEREEYGFEEVDMGNVFHGVLEHFAEKLTERGYTWFDFPKEAGEELVLESLKLFAAEYKDTVLFSTAKNRYAISRMERILKRTVNTLQYQLQKGSFVPKDFEVSFSALEDLEAVNIALTEQEKMKLKGRIDRIDTAEDENTVYVKVIDYKSGNKSFDLVSLYYGLQLQLVVYMNAAVGMTKRENPEKEVIPAAILYYHVADPMVKNEGENISPEELGQRIRRELAMNGLVNMEKKAVELLDQQFSGKSDVIPVERKKDGTFSARSSLLGQEDFEKISNYVNYKIKEIGNSIIEGDIQINPYEKGQQSSCTYCSYKGVCGFDTKIPGFEKRQLDLSAEEIMERMKRED